MRTKLTKDPADAAKVINRGGLAAFPTETVYGLGAGVFDEAAIGKIFQAKGRPQDNPLIVHIARVEDIERLAVNVPAYARALIAEHFPGPLTIVVKKRAEVPESVTAGLDSIGIRMPSAELAREFLSKCEMPVAAPSANLSGRPSPTTWQAVLEDLDDRVDCILKGDPTDVGIESTVVDCTGDVPVILRLGALSSGELGLNIVRGDDDAMGALKSPGLRHRHYSPSARVMLVDDLKLLRGGENVAFIGLRTLGVEMGYAVVCRNEREYAHKVFEFFRECDRRGIETIYCETVWEGGIGAALMDRLRRAAE
ncbi:MAG: threonylcarbamoyl-AMP synthase [Blastocatellia bacterium]|nr:threonylcarbamoyl-AMP synthase [Blastocatellia bacterium]